LGGISWGISDVGRVLVFFEMDVPVEFWFSRKLQNIGRKSEKNIQFSFEKHQKKENRL